MKKVDITIELAGKKNELHYQTGTLYTNSPKYFMKYYTCNEVEECGIFLSGKSIALAEDDDKNKDTNNPVEEVVQDRYIAMPSAEAAVANYKKALKVVDIEDAVRVKINKQILEKIKKDIVDPNLTSSAMFGLIWLFSNKSVGYTCWLAALTLLCNINLYEAICFAKAACVSDNDRQLLEGEIWNMGLGEMIYNPVKKEDLKLYMKVKDGNFKFK